MAKKHWGRLAVFAAVTGAVAAGISYVLQYKTYHNELEKDFREFEDGEDDSETPQDHTIDPRSSNRNYIALSSSKDEFKIAAKDIAHATKHVLKDAGSILTDTAHEAVSAAVDTAHMALHSMKAKKADFMEGRARDEEKDEDIFEDEGFLDDDYVDEDELYDYSPINTSHDSRFQEDYDEHEPDNPSEKTGHTPKKADSEALTAVIEEDTLE